jgi:ABC-type lipoprotein export system ATPase subunit
LRRRPEPVPIAAVTDEFPLACTALDKTYRLGKTKLPILRAVDVTFPGHGINTIQGASGSGKSTLLQILGGLEAPDAGEVRWRGESIYTWSRAQLAAWRNLTVGFVFQAYHLFPELTALENVEFPARLARRGDAKLGAHLLDQVGLGSRLQHLPTELSGGEQQRIAIARALRNNPALLLADEPTGNLDQATGHGIIELLLRLQKERQNCVIIVTHDNAIAALGQQRFHLEDGRLDARHV